MKNPCETCKKVRENCRCDAYKQWFSEEWKAMQKLFEEALGDEFKRISEAGGKDDK